MSTPTNSDNIIDSRDVIARIEELEGEREALVEDYDNAQAEIDGAPEDYDAGDLIVALEVARESLEAWDASEEADELKALRDLASECEGYSDWSHGETLIHDDYFQTYAEDLANDCGMIPDDVKWPMNHIDWEAAADELKHDYTQVDFDGETYWIRS